MAKKQKVLLDTSIQIGKLKYKEIRDHIKKCSKTEDLSTSFFVLFEFKVGLILSLVEFYDMVNISTAVPQAINRWSERWGQREPKYFMLLEAIIRERFGSSSGSKKKYLRQIETAIFSMLANFFTDIRSVPIGDFRYDEIVRFEINSKNEYPAFSRLCEERCGMTDQRKFWGKHVDDLIKLTADTNLSKKYKAMHGALSKIQSDIKYAHMVNTNKAVGDAVIAADTRPGTRILTTDRSFEILAPILSKEFERIPNKYI